MALRRSILATAYTEDMREYDSELSKLRAEGAEKGIWRSELGDGSHSPVIVKIDASSAMRIAKSTCFG
jgi:hypothetical protein